jgi:hypothetical protein
VVAAGYQLVMSVIRVVRWPWKQFHDLDQSIPILAYLASMVLLIGFTVFLAWFMPRFHRVVPKFYSR